MKIADQHIYQKTQRQLTHRLSHSFSSIAAAHLTLTIGNTLIYINQLPPFSIAYWALAILTILGGRLYTLFKLKDIHLTQKQVKRLYILNFILSCMMGLGWSFLAIYILLNLDISQSIIVYMTVAGISAGSIYTASVARYLFIFFNISLLLPLTVSLFLVGTTESITLSFFNILYTIIILQSGIQMHKLMQRNLYMQTALSKAKDDAEVLARKLFMLSSKDALTQLPNRRMYDRILHRSWQQSTDTSQPLSILMCDIDFFKRYNDIYGHQTGDLCLQSVSKTFKQCANKHHCFVARIGGEEFVFILNQKSLDHAERIALSLIKDIIAINIKHQGSPYKLVTLSIGLASKSPLDNNESMLIERADKALYHAKHAGRNQLVISKTKHSHKKVTEPELTIKTQQAPNNHNNNKHLH